MTSRLATLTRRLLGLENSPGGAATDRQLLERFVRDRDQAAFAAILERHGPMVLAVCRRVLGRSADADDAFQATFLVLVRRVASVGWHDSLGGWLHAVAYRVAHKARSNAARAADLVRRSAPQEVPMPDADPPTVVAHRELCAALDAELAELPEKYRLPLVLCYLEGRTNEEAAVQLGWTKGTVSGRLSRARDLLRGRLARRGLAPSVAAIEVALGNMASAAPPPAPLFESALRAAVLSESGSAAVAGAVSARAVALTEGVSRAMSLTRLKVMAAALLAFCLLGTGATLLAYHALGADQKEMKEAKEEPAPKPADKPPAKPMTDDEKLQGTWTIANAAGLQKGTQWTFNGGQLEGYGQPNKGSSTRYKLDPEQKPKSIDLTAQVGDDGPVLFQVKGIYQLEGDELKVCFAPGKEERPKAFPAGGVGSVLILKREPPVKVVFLDKRGGKPPMQFYFVTLELTNPRDRPIWLVTRYSGDEPLTGSGKFLEQQDGKPQMLAGAGYDGKKGGGNGEAVEVRYVGNFRAFYLAPKTTVRFDRYEISCCEDIKHFEVWEVSSLLVNGRTALDKWLPYRTQSGGDVVIPAKTDWDNLDFDRQTSRSRTDYPDERIEFVKAEVIRKWLLPIAKLGVKAEKPKTPLDELQGTWHPVSAEAGGKPLTKEQLEEFHEKLVIDKDRYTEVRGDFGMEAILKLDPAKKPRAFDLFTRTTVTDKGVKQTTEERTGLGIYELDGDTLKVATAGEDGARPTGFKTAADSAFAVVTYKRGVPPAKPDPQKQPEFVEAEITLRPGAELGEPYDPKKDVKKTVKDKATLAKFVACFPEMGRGKKSNTSGGWLPRMTFTFKGSKGETVTVSSTWTNWGEGNGDWRVKANLMKYAGELFEVPRLIDQGTLADDWELATLEEGGKKRDTQNVELAVNLDTFELHVGDKVEWEVEYTLDPGKKPREIDLVLNAGTNDAKTYRGIYTIERDSVKICFDKGGKKRPAEFKTAAGNADEVLIVLTPAQVPGAGAPDTPRK